ncbi:CWF19-like protein 2 homolog isoform X2 [Diabrotica virgifera virgifera]|uniref:CWF19-like protein 2 n=1 Tax=Diabrotica virgifera virgifera TaxID=50390 RepID=A0ABM5KNT1_DIAVI|nr:CWF19-like protein 2 homolog isoform X2 [Diabrotica virgifera virgifera]
MGKSKKSKKSKRYSSSDSEDEWVEKEVVESKKKKSKHKKKKSSYSSSSDSQSSSDEGYMKKKSKKNKNYEYSSSSDSSDGDRSSKYKRSSYRSRSRSPPYKSNMESQESKLQKQESSAQREEWMNIQTKFLTSSNSDRKKERDEQKRLEREKQQYDPRSCDRELNPYWKHGGDGLPGFKKPALSDDEDSDRRHRSSGYRSQLPSTGSSSWRKKQDSDSKSTRPSSSTSNWKKKKDSEESKTSNTIDSPSIKHVPDTKEVTKEVPETVEYTEKDLNALAAKLVKAEIMGNQKQITELKEKLEQARKSVQQKGAGDEEVLLTQTDSRGQSKPLRLQSEYGEASNSRKKKKTETHRDNQRVRYFADDDKYSLKEMFENEKYQAGADQDKEFIKAYSKIKKNDDLDDIFSDNIREKQSDSKTDEKNRSKAIQDHKKVSKSLDNCDRCIQSECMLKHLMISMGDTLYLALPSFEPLTEGHCLIVPIRHTPCATQLDENEWSDILDVRKALVRLFKEQDEDVIFFESAKGLHRFPHMVIECIPVPKEEGDLAPIYFKKAIDESEIEWAQNKKLVSLKGRDVRKAIPKGLSYFSVSFGMEEGFAHVIEDEQLFPDNFAQEIIGGMLDVHHSKWRKPKNQKFEEQSKRVMEFSKKWKDFDCLANY